MGTYAKAFEIPEEFPSILREFAKEAIREQPADIYRSVLRCMNGEVGSWIEVQSSNNVTRKQAG